jgi:hypothetical protein
VLGDFVKALFARGASHPRIHVGVFVSLASDRYGEVISGRTDRLAGYRIADLFEVFEMTVGMAGLAFREASVL